MVKINFGVPPLKKNLNLFVNNEKKSKLFKIAWNGEKMLVTNGKNLSCSRSPKMARKLVEKIFGVFSPPKNQMRKLKLFAWNGETNIWIFSPPQEKLWHGAHLMQPFFCIEPLPRKKNNVPHCMIWQENLSILYFRTPNQPPPHWQQKKRKIIITVTNWSNSFLPSSVPASALLDWV